MAVPRNKRRQTVPLAFAPCPMVCTPRVASKYLHGFPSETSMSFSQVHTIVNFFVGPKWGGIGSYSQTGSHRPVCRVSGRGNESDSSQSSIRHLPATHFVAKPNCDKALAECKATPHALPISTILNCSIQRFASENSTSRLLKKSGFGSSSSLNW